MLEHLQQFLLKPMATEFGVTRSGYHAWRKSSKEPSVHLLRQHCRNEQIKAIFVQSKERSGARRIQVDLAEDGENADLKTIINSMTRQNLVAKAARKFKTTTHCNHQLPVEPNLQKQKFDATGPNPKWVGDITYLMTSEGWIYLSLIIALYSRAVIG